MDTPSLFHLLADGPVDGETLARRFPAAGAMANTPQDPVYHAEGDVWTHTLMVLDRVGSHPWTGETGAVLRLAALLHDVAKAETTVSEFCPVEERVRIRQPHHAAKGRDAAWRMLTDAGLDPFLKREICAVIGWHQRPVHMPDQRHIATSFLRYAALGHGWRRLLDFCRADTQGRIAPNIAESLDLLALVEDEGERVSGALGIDLLDSPAPLDGARVRHLYAHPAADIHHTPFGATDRPTLTLLSGPPGAGKSTFRDSIDGVVISLDDARARIRGFRHGSANEGCVLQDCLRGLKAALAARQDAVWDATLLTRQARAKIVRIGEAYGARTRILSFEDPIDACMARNAARGDGMVPSAIALRMAARREAVGADEAECVEPVLMGRVVSPKTAR